MVNIESTVQSIQRAVEEAELMAGCEIHSVFAGIAGSHVRSLNSHGVVAIRDREVTEVDVQHVIDAAKAVAIPADQRILHVLPQEYIIDGQEGIRDPIGMSGVRLEAKVHIVHRRRQRRAEHHQVRAALRPRGRGRGAGNSWPPATPCSPTTRRNWACAWWDIGGGTTDIAVFSQGAIRHTAVIPSPATRSPTTSPVSMRTPTHYAEDIKVRYACALSQLANSDESIEVPSVGDRPARRLARQTLAEVVEPRYEELFGLIRDELRRSGFEETIAAGIVMTGGSARWKAPIDLAEEIFHMPVRLGLPHQQQVKGLADCRAEPHLFDPAVGLLLHARENSQGPGRGRSLPTNVQGAMDRMVVVVQGQFLTARFLHPFFLK